MKLLCHAIPILNMLGFCPGGSSFWPGNLFHPSQREARFNEIRDEMKRILTRGGWPKKMVEGSIPILPICAFTGDNVINVMVDRA